MQWLKPLVASALFSLAVVGCGGGPGGPGGPGGGSMLGTPTGFGSNSSPGPGPGGSNTPPPNPNDKMLNGPYGMVSATLGSSAHTLLVSAVGFDGQGAVISGNGQGATFSNSRLTALSAPGVTGGKYDVNSDGTFTTSVNLTTGATLVSAAARIDSDGSLAAAGFNDNTASPGLLVVVSPSLVATDASLHGTFRLNVAEVGAQPGFATGTVDYDGQGGITAGSLTFSSDGSTITVTSGSYNVNADGTVTGSIAFSDGSTTTFDTYLGREGTLVGSFQDARARLGLVVASQGPSTASSNGDLMGSDTLFFLRTIPFAGGFVTGSASLDGHGGVSGGTFTDDTGHSQTVSGGRYAVNADGTLSATSLSTADGATVNVPTAILGADKNSASGVFSDTNANSGLFLLLK